MFWRLEAVQSAQLSNLLDKPDVTLFEIMEDEFLLQEVKCGNKRLIDFLIKEENLLLLTKLCVTEPENAANGPKKYKYCHLASEIISAGSESVTSALANCSSCYQMLADFVRPSGQEAPKILNPLLASFFNKVFSLLVSKHTDQVFQFMQKEPAFLDHLIENLDTSALAESLFRLSCAGESTPNAILMKKWLVERSFIPKLISQLDSSKPEEAHQNATFLLCELIRTLRRDQLSRDDNVSAEEFIDPLVENFESRPILEDLLDRTLATKDLSKSQDSLTSNGCAIFLTLLQTIVNRNNPLRCINDLGKYDPDLGKQYQDDDFLRLATTNRPPGIMWEPDVNRVAETCLKDRLSEMKRLLVEDVNKKEPILLPMGKLDAPLGAAKLALTQLIAETLTVGRQHVHDEVARLEIIRVLIDLFFKHQWNNFLHTNVVNCIITSFYQRFAFYAFGGEEKADTEAPTQGNKAEDDGFDDQCQCAHLFYPSSLLKQVVQSYHIFKLIVDERRQSLDRVNGIVPPYIGHIMRLAVAAHYGMRDGPNAKDMKAHFDSLPSDEQEAWNTFVDNHLLDYIKRNEPDQVGVVPSRDDGVLTDHMEDFTGSLPEVPKISLDFLGFGKTVVPGSDAKLDDNLNKPLSQLTAADFLKDEPMDEDAFEALSAKMHSGLPDFGTGDDDDMWKEKEITFGDTVKDKFDNTVKWDDFGAQPHPGTVSSGQQNATMRKKTSSSDEEVEEMDVDKESAPAEWFSSSSSKGTSNENWASFDEDWPTPNSAPSSGKKKEQSGQSNWAQFEHQQQPEKATSTSGNAKEGDVWQSNFSNISATASKRSE